MVNMEATQWIASTCFVIWGLAHVMFGLTSLKAALTNDLFALWQALIGGHPALDSLEAPSKSMPKGPNFILAQHALNIVKPGTIALILGFYLVPNSDKYPFVTFVLSVDIFFDHNFYGVMADWTGITVGVAYSMLYFANIAVLCSLYNLAYEVEAIEPWLAILAIVLTSTVMLISTILSVLRALGVSNPCQLTVLDVMDVDVEKGTTTAVEETTSRNA